MTIQEALLKQVAFLRQCQDERKKASQAFSEANSAFKKAERIANLELAEGLTHTSEGDELKLGNDQQRRGYVKGRISELEGEAINAKLALEDAASKVEVERSILSAIKDLRGDAELDLSHLTKYDI